MSSTGNFIKDLPSWAKGTLAVGLTAGIIYLGYKVYKKINETVEQNKEDGKDLGIAPSLLINSFSNIPTNIGKGATLSKKGDSYTVPLTSNKIKYYFVFYSNGRVLIYRDNIDVKNIVSKGKYFDSGKEIKLDDGKSFQYNSVWQNINNLIKGL